jgi:hypothetical protein
VPDLNPGFSALQQHQGLGQRAVKICCKAELLQLPIRIQIT